MPDVVSDMNCVFGDDAEEQLQGIALVGAGSIVAFQSIQTYVIDSFALYAASGVISVSPSLVSLLTLPDHRSSCGGCILALAGRLRFPVVRSDNVQRIGLRQRRHCSCLCGHRYRLPRVRNMNHLPRTCLIWRTQTLVIVVLRRADTECQPVCP